MDSQWSQAPGTEGTLEEHQHKIGANMNPHIDFSYVTKMEDCPFCGADGESEVGIHQWYEDYAPTGKARDFFAVCCSNCFAQGPAAMDAEAAIEGWNAPRLR